MILKELTWDLMIEGLNLDEYAWNYLKMSTIIQLVSIEDLTSSFMGIKETELFVLIVNISSLNMSKEMTSCAVDIVLTSANRFTFQQQMR